MSPSLLGDLAILGAGFVAGAVNAVVGSGSVLTYPTLVGLGYGPVVANVSNDLGLVPGSVSGALGYRAELRGSGPLLRRLAPASLVGGLLGAVLLLVLPQGVFGDVVPVLVFASALLVGLQPRLAAYLARRGERPAVPQVGLQLGVFLTGVYGGYFGAAQGVLLLGLLGLLLPIGLQQANAIKNVLAGLVNAVAAVVFLLAAHIAWVPVLLIAVASSAGGVVGARYGRRLRPTLLRRVVMVVGIGVAVYLAVRVAT